MYPNVMRCATSSACQCSSGLKYVCTSKEFNMRKAKQSIKTLFDEESRMELSILFSAPLKGLNFSSASLSATVTAALLRLIIDCYRKDQKSNYSSCYEPIQFNVRYHGKI